MTPTLSYLSLPIGIALGALHALEPGHSKTMVAAFLIGIKGTRRDAFLLGTSAAATHSLVVIGISVAALWFGREAFTEAATGWLQLGSALVVIALGVILMVRRWPRRPAHAHAHHAPDPVRVATKLANGLLEIIDTPTGERMRLRLESPAPPGFAAEILIQREAGQVERLLLRQDAKQPLDYVSDVAPAEPHEFTAEARIAVGAQQELVPFAMHEPEGHSHDHLDEDAHARAHAAAMPKIGADGKRPSFGQVIAFGAAGGMIPCSASITVMLLALSTGQFLLGLISVLCFSLGLAATLVIIGMVVVAGASRLSSNPTMAKVAPYAPAISSAVIILSGVAALFFARGHVD